MDDIFIKRLMVGALSANCYIVGSVKTGEGLVIDPGGDAGEITHAIDQSALQIKSIVLTHGHSDHLAALYDIQSYTRAAVAIHITDSHILEGRGEYNTMFGISYRIPAAVDRLLHDNEVIEMGDIRFRVIHTPGHTPGSICLHTDNIVFTGDTLMYRGIGTTFTLGSNRRQLINSIQSRLIVLSEDTVLYPGHGRQTTIGFELRNNSYINRG